MIVLSVIFLLIGLSLLVGGLWLIVLGGSWFYAPAGIALMLIGILTQTRRPMARLLYSVFLLCTALWSLWEAGFDWWPLASRLGMFLLLAIPLLFPGHGRERGNAAPLLAVWVVLSVTMLSSLAYDAHRIEGEVTTDTLVGNPRIGKVPNDSWFSYGRSNMGQRYSPLEQITPDNVHELVLAWQYETGDRKGPNDIAETTYEATPLKIGNTLYLCTPHNWLVALDADSGKELWVYDAQVPPQSQRQHQTCRGVSYLPPQQASTAIAPGETSTTAAQNLPGITCDAQLYLPTSDARLIALDPATGARCNNFAHNGILNLMHNMPYRQGGFYYSTSPPVVAGGVVVVAGSVNDNYDIHSPSGVIRAYDAKTGELRWNWDAAKPQQTEPISAGETYTASSPNSWAVGSADEELGLVYFPMGNRTPDQLGMYRTPAEEKYSSSVVALSLETGEVKWVQQFVHHDLWDMDTPAQPSLVDIKTASGIKPGLVVPTKQGDVYVLNRETGAPLLPITEKKAPQGTIEGDYAALTQPASRLNFRPPTVKESDMWGASAIDQMICRIQFRSLRYEGRYTPPSEQGTLVDPGNLGVFNWGSIAVDPERQVMFGMPVHMAFVSKLVRKKDGESAKDATNQGEQGLNENAGAPYAVELHPFMSPLGVPCQRPPWGYVAAADLRTGDILWMHKNGTIKDMTPLSLPLKLGVPGIGGPVITAGGVVFLAATVDDYIRAYNLTNGKQLWQARLPAGGQATPMTYLNSAGEQMVVLVAGGHGSVGTTIGDYVVAYQLKHHD